ncbi:MAG: PAS domain S-box protein, partial [Chitinophagaceae bacterium]
MRTQKMLFAVNIIEHEESDIVSVLQQSYNDTTIQFTKDINEINTDCDCCIIEVSTTDSSNFNSISQFKKTNPEIPLIVISSIEEIDFVVSVFNAGANNFLFKKDLKKLPDLLQKELSEKAFLKQEIVLEKTLQKIANALNNNERSNFFDFCTTEIEKLTKADFVFISTKNKQNGNILDVISISHKGKILDNFSYSIKGTPCEESIAHSVCSYTKNVADIFRKDTLLAEMHIEGYVGVSLFNSNNEYCAVVAAMYQNSVEDSHSKIHILQLFSTFIVGEIERQAFQTSLLENEINLNKAQDLANIGSWEYNLQTNELRWSKKLYEILELDTDTPKDQLFNAYIEKLLPTDASKIYDYIEKRDNYQFEHTIESKSGEIKHLYCIGTFTYNNTGEAILLNGTAQDITETKKIELEVIQNEEKFRSLVHNISDIITLVNAEGTILYQSSSIKQVMGYTENELLGRNIFELLAEEDRERIASIFLESINKEGNSEMVEFRFLDKNNEFIYLEAQGNNQLHNPAINAIIINSRDITERKRIEKTILEKSKLLEAIANVSNYMIQADDWDTLLSKTLATVGVALHADSMYYFENSVDAKYRTPTTSLKFEWNNLGVESRINKNDLQNIAFEQIQDFINPLVEFQHFYAIVSKLPNTSRAKPFLESQGIKSILLLPLFTNKLFSGFIGVDDYSVERTWSVDEISILQSLCGNLSTAKEKKLNEAAIIASNERFEYVTQATSDAIWDKNLITKETYWSKNYELLFGYELTNTEGDFYNFEKCIH